MITDERVLEDEYVPRTLRHRDGALEQIANAFADLNYGWQPNHVLIFGPTGSGKTCLARHATNKIQYDPTVEFNIASQYVDCWRDNTRFQVLHSVVSSFDHAAPSREAATTGSLLTRMEAYDGPHFVVVLDEAELLQDPNIVRDYHGRDGFSLVVIASDRNDFFRNIPEAVASRLVGPRITLGRYSLSALVSILEDRVEQGIEPGAIDTTQLETIADYAAGNAKEAITMLRLAAETAEAGRARGVTDEMIDDAAERAGIVIEERRIEQLGPEQRLIYEIVRDADGELTATDVYDEYSDRMDTGHDRLKSNKTIRRYLLKLAEYDLIKKSGSKRGRRYYPLDGAPALSDILSDTG